MAVPIKSVIVTSSRELSCRFGKGEIGYPRLVLLDRDEGAGGVVRTLDHSQGNGSTYRRAVSAAGDGSNTASFDFHVGAWRKQFVAVQTHECSGHLVIGDLAG